MHFLSPEEVGYWRKAGDAVAAKTSSLKEALSGIRSGMIPAFYFYCGALLAAQDRDDDAEKCFIEGALCEHDGIFSNAFIAGFMERHQHRLQAPAVCFADPAPYVHFTTTPQFKASRRNFLDICNHSLPDFPRPFSIIDLGTGNGALLAELLLHLQRNGRIREIDQILLVDSSPSMLELAVRTVADVIPIEKIRTMQCRIQDAVTRIDRHYDVALSSLAYHHMPYQDKALHLKTIKPKIDHFIIFEMDADNDRHDLYSPELSLAVYQSYGRMIDFIFQHDAPLPVTQMSVDNFLMTEEISFLTQPHGVRTDYHMLQSQWLKLFDQVLAPEFSCRCHSNCHSDEYLSLFAIHYGR